VKLKLSCPRPNLALCTFSILLYFSSSQSAHPTVSLNKSFRNFLHLQDHEAELRAAQQGLLGSTTTSAAAGGPPSSLTATKAAATVAGPGAPGAAGISSTFRGQPAQPSQHSQAQPHPPSAAQQQLKQQFQQTQRISQLQPQAQAAPPSLPLVETATLQTQPNLVEPKGFKTTGVAEAPPAPHDESATATTQVEVRLPPVSVPQVTGKVEAARKEVIQAKREEDESRKLNERALQLERATEGLGQRASDKMREATLLREKEEELKRQATVAASEADTLEKAARAKRSESSHYWSLSQEREEEARRREEEGERLMLEYNEALKKAQAAKQEADLLHRDAEAKRLEATEALERAAAEVVERERESEIQGQQETVRQAAYAAAAAARAKLEIAEAGEFSLIVIDGCFLLPASALLNYDLSSPLLFLLQPRLKPKKRLSSPRLTRWLRQKQKPKQRCNWLSTVS
jgi:hypothetical protein